jgi:hypothetical protein
VSYYVIEGTHAIAETGVLIALVGVWNAGPWTRPTKIALLTAMVSTGLLALLTYLTVVLMAAGVSPEATGDVASLFFLASLVVEPGEAAACDRIYGNRFAVTRR